MQARVATLVLTLSLLGYVVGCGRTDFADGTVGPGPVAQAGDETGAPPPAPPPAPAPAPAPPTPPPTSPAPPSPADPPTDPRPSEPADCRITLSPASINVTETGGRREIVITTGPSCAWRAAADAGWVSPGPASGTGPGQVVLVIAANSGSSTRATTVHVGEEEVSVTQSAPAEPACDGLRLARIPRAPAWTAGPSPRPSRRPRRARGT